MNTGFNSADEGARHIARALQFPSYLILALWAIHILKIVFDWSWGNYGLLPREVSGLVGIFTSPFIHGNFQHLLSNSVPLFLLTLLILIFYRRVAYQSMLMIYVLTGLAVWTFARGNVLHIGASGVVYGLVSFVFWIGLFKRNVKSIILALIVTFLYSSYFLGVLPNQRGISWESHLFGGLVGILVAFWMKDYIDPGEKFRDKLEEDNSASEYYLPRDVFEKTRKQRQSERERESQGGFWVSDST